MDEQVGAFGTAHARSFRRHISHVSENIVDPRSCSVDDRSCSEKAFSASQPIAKSYAPNHAALAFNRHRFSVVARNSAMAVGIDQIFDHQPFREFGLGVVIVRAALEAVRVQVGQKVF